MELFSHSKRKDLVGSVVLFIYTAKAMNLVSVEGKKLPYVAVKLNRETRYARNWATYIIKNTEESWDKEILFSNVHLTMDGDVPVAKEDQIFDIQIIDTDENGEEHSIGAVSIPIAPFKRGTLEKKWYSMNKQETQLYVGIQPIDFGKIALPATVVSPPMSMPTKLGSIKSSEFLVSFLRISPRSVPHPPTPNNSPVTHNSFIKSAPAELTNFKSGHIRRNHPHLAAGSFGVVYKGKVKGIKGYVAVKDIDLLTKDAANAWKQEIELMSLNHSRYVVNVYGYSYSDKRLSIVMEYMNRGSLRSLLHDSKIQLPLIHRIRMARHCIRGLIFLHLNGIVHRDIKSANILVGKDYSCKISDFGCAKLMENLIDENSDRVGTPLWMAPEVTKRKEYSVSADVYSMGIVVYEILEGDLPVFDKEEKRAKLPLNFLTQKVVMPCLSDNPNERPPLGDLLEALDRWIRQLLIQIHAGLPNDWRKKAQLSFEFQIESGRTKGLKSSDGLNFEELIKLYNFLIFQDINKVNNLLDKVLTNIEPPYLQHNSTSPPDSSESLNDSEAFSDDWGTTSSGSDDETIIKKITKPKKHIKKSDSMIDDLGIDDLSLLKAINKRKLSGSKNSVPLLSTLPQMNTKRSSAKRPTRLENPESPKSPKTPLSNSSTPPKLSGHSNYRRAVSHSTSPVLPKNPKEPKDPKSSSGELRPPNMNRKSSTSIIHSPSKKNARSPPMPTSTGPSLVSSNDLQSTDIAQLMEEELQRLMGMSIIEMINNPDYDKRGNSSTHKKLT